MKEKIIEILKSHVVKDVHVSSGYYIDFIDADDVDEIADKIAEVLND